MSDPETLQGKSPGVFFSISGGGEPLTYDVENQAFRQRLRDAVQGDASPSQNVRTLLNIAASWFGVEMAYVSRIDPAAGIYEIVEVSRPDLPYKPGDQTDLATTYCRRVVANGKALGVNEASKQGWLDDPAYETFGFETYLGGKLVVRNRLYGTVCLADEAPRPEPYTESDAAALELVIRTIAQVLERARGQERLRRTSARLEALFEASPNLLHIHDQDGRIIVPNPSLCEKTGYREEELVEMRVWELDADGDEREARSRWTELGPDESRSWEGAYQCKDGSQLPVQIDVRFLEVDGKPRFLTTSQDISERKEGRRQLREMNRRLEAVLDTVDAAIFIKDRDGRYQLVNQRCVELLGADSESEVLGKTDHDFFSSDVANRYQKDDRRTMEEGETVRIEEEIPTPEGTQVNLTLKSPLLSDRGEPVGVCAVSTDISEQKEREHELRRVKTFNRELVQRAPVGLIRLDENLHITYENPRAKEIFGLPDDQEESDAIGMDIRKFPSVVEAGVADKLNRLLKGEEVSLDVEFESVYGRRAHLRGRGVPIVPGADFKGAVIMLEDVTQEKEHEKMVRDRRQKVESLYRAADRLLRAERPAEVAERICELVQHVFDYRAAGVAFTDDEHIVVREEAVANGRGPFFRDVFASSDDPVLSRVLETEETVVTQDGEDREFPFDSDVLSSVAAVPIGQHGVIVIGAGDDDEVDSFDLRLTEILGTYASLVLDHLLREEELVEAKDEAERMNRIKSAFLANMSHEIRTPLTSIIGFAEVIGEEVVDEDEGRTVGRFARLIEESGRRLLDTLDAVLDLSKLEAGEFQLERERVRLDTLVEETVDLRRVEAGDNDIDFEFTVDRAPIEGWWNRGALTRILANLLDNAIKFTPEGGTIFVRVHGTKEEAVVEVEDTGIGIREEIRNQIFDPFTQESEGLTREYEGTGLGLSIVRSMVNLLDGAVAVDSTEGEGTCFVVRLPYGRSDESPS